MFFFADLQWFWLSDQRKYIKEKDYRYDPNQCSMSLKASNRNDLDKLQTNIMHQQQHPSTYSLSLVTFHLHGRYVPCKVWREVQDHRFLLSLLPYDHLLKSNRPFLDTFNMKQPFEEKSKCLLNIWDVSNSQVLGTRTSVPPGFFRASTGSSFRSKKQRRLDDSTSGRRLERSHIGMKVLKPDLPLKSELLNVGRTVSM